MPQTNKSNIQKLTNKLQLAVKKNGKFILYKKDKRFYKNTAYLVFTLNTWPGVQNIQHTWDSNYATVFTGTHDPLYLAFIKKNKGIKKYKKKFQ